jgi:hypothetical protein
VEEKRLARIEDKESKSKVKPVYFSLTETSLKQYQHDFLGIDEVKNRRRKLFQLLFLYEMCAGSKKIHTLGTSYSRNLPGFTLQEIYQYPEQQRLFYPRIIADVPWFHYSTIFTHIQFEIDEIKDALKHLEKVHLIKPLPLTNNSNSNQNLPAELQTRYYISDNRLQVLIHIVWNLYKQKISILETKYLQGTFTDNDRIWLTYIHGKESTRRLIEEWEDRRSRRTFSEQEMEIKNGQLVLAERGYSRIREVEFNMKVEELMKKYIPLLDEYNLPVSYIRTILSIS